MAGESAHLKNWYCPKCGSEDKEHPQDDLLEKLAMIKEAVERNPDEWWRELEYKVEEWFTCKSREDVFDVITGGDELRLKPQRVKVEGWVDAEVIEWARVVSRPDYHPTESEEMLAQALLDCVKKKG